MVRHGSVTLWTPGFRQYVTGNTTSSNSVTILRFRTPTHLYHLEILHNDMTEWKQMALQKEHKDRIEELKPDDLSFGKFYLKAAEYYHNNQD